MNSVPSPEDNARLNRQTARLSRVDACPQGCDSYEFPTAVADALEGFSASYTCGFCHHSWITGWGD